MRMIRILPLAAVLALLGSAAVAQTDTPKGYTGAYGPDAPNRAFGGPVPEVYLGPGLDQVGPDGISTKVVKAVPCSAAARETDGTTTCIGSGLTARTCLLERDDFSSNRHPALPSCLSMISAQTRSAFVARENRCPLFRIML
jgi:hypothetical protein